MNTQNPNNIFVFDMDNTLIKTDKANNLAYSEAISSVLGVNCNIENGKRFTRNELKELFPQLSQAQIDEIIERKVHIPEHTRSLSGSLLGYKTIP